MAKRGFNVVADGYIDWDETSALQVVVEGEEYMVGVGPDASTARWSLQVHLRDPGLFPKTRAQRLAGMKRLEASVHEVLGQDLRANGVVWNASPRNGDPGRSEP